jgi:hypothetical protein
MTIDGKPALSYISRARGSTVVLIYTIAQQCGYFIAANTGYYLNRILIGPQPIRISARVSSLNVAHIVMYVLIAYLIFLDQSIRRPIGYWPSALLVALSTALLETAFTFMFAQDLAPGYLLGLIVKRLLYLLVILTLAGLTSRVIARARRV